MAAIENQGQGTQQQGPEESRVFEPSAAFAAQATISGMAAYHAMVKEAETDYEGFWARLARENLSWKKPFTRPERRQRPILQMVRGRPAERVVQLPGPQHRKRPGRQDGHHLRSG